MKLNEVKSLKEQIVRRLATLTTKRREFALVSGKNYNHGLDYIFFTKSQYVQTIQIARIFGIVIAVIATMFSLSLPFGIFSGIIAGVSAIIGVFLRLYKDNKNERKWYKENGNGVVTICRYTQELLDEICEQIALVDKDIEVAKATKIEREQQEVKEREDRERREAEARERKMREAKILRGKFVVLFGIIDKELDGSVEGSGENGEILDTDTEVSLELPFESNGYLEYEWQTFKFTHGDFRKLLFRVSQLQQTMSAFHSLEKTVDAAVSSEQ